MSGVRLPIDRLAALWPTELSRARIGAVLHPASVSRTLIHSLHVLEQFNGNLFEIAALFGPQHGLLGQTQDNMIEWEGFRHRRLGVAGLQSVLSLPGVVFREAYFQPTFHKYAGEICAGAQLHVTNRDVFPPFRAGVEIIRHVRERYGAKFQWKAPPYEYEYKRLPIEILIGGPVASLFGG